MISEIIRTGVGNRPTVTPITDEAAQTIVLPI